MNNKNLKKIRMSTQKIEQVMAWLQETMEIEQDTFDNEPETLEGNEKENISFLDEQIGRLKDIQESLTETFQLV
jgi:predicted nucleic acid-binding protein